ncbi:class I SAM-dependent methyltransferase [Bifidobacterium sp. UBA744]|uniref:class I SAM-dependent methyltransferase n=1 Tax=Bifidobacterium sp. UBA744 TaxID=1946112 RepID=UPI0025B993A7|nr:class I SAM-dependent methyltransferase [Bifidobacterium sp. UBA744]
MMMNEETWDFVRTHRDDDIRTLALHAKRRDGIDMPMALDQIAGWQTARTKLPQWAASDGIVYPPHISMEQCSSQFTAQYKAKVARRLIRQSNEDAANRRAPSSRPDPIGGTSLVDLTGGFGVDCSYMARAVDHATYVERQPHLCALAEHNMAALGLSHVDVVNADADAYLQSMSPATLVFLDPARRDAHGQRTYAITDCAPDALALKHGLLAKAAYVMIKLSPMLDWRKTVADFDGAVHEVHIVATANECKELLVVLGHGICHAPLLFCVNDGQRTEIQPDEATTAAGAKTAADNVGLTSSELRGCRLYEPNAALMKAGCFDAIAQRFGVSQIASNSHLFISRGDVPDFPGRRFVIEASGTLGKKELRATLAGLSHANITVRNFPMTVAALRRKLKLGDGGGVYLFATTDAAGRHLLIRCRKPPVATTTTAGDTVTV